MKTTYLFFISCFLLCVSSAAVASDYVTELQKKAVAEQLAADRGWLALGHYRDAYIVSEVVSSEADDVDFFVSVNGKKNPQDELLATIAAFFDDSNLSDRHAQCVFPARFYWLDSKLVFDKSKLPRPLCREFNEWKNTLNANSAVLIFPSAYMNSPSSMFGHTFLRLDPPAATQRSDLLSYAVNYAADVNAADNEMMFAYKGIFGGYPGTTFVQPYYEKVKEYHDWENRDIWEYTLNLNQSEVDQLVRHAWEIKPINFDYYFFTENCSYRVLDLIEVARPSLNIVDQFRVRAIPADTVRAVVDAQLVANIAYRPSAATELAFKVKQLSAQQQEMAKALALGTIKTTDVAFNALQDQEKAVVLESAFSYLHYKQLHEKLARETVAGTGLQLLAERSRLKNVTPLPLPPAPLVRPDEGHDTRKFSWAAGVLDDKAYTDIGFQSAYHGFLDPSPGYQRGAQIEFFSAHLRVYEEHRVEVESLKLIDIASLTPRDDFFEPWSWKAGVGLRRALVGDQRPLVGYGEVAGGVSYLVSDQLLFLLLDNELEADNAFEKDHRVGAGPIVGWQWQAGNHQGMVQFKTLDYWSGDRDTLNELQYEQTWAVNENIALSVSVKQTHNQEDKTHEVQGGIHVYF